MLTIEKIPLNLLTPIAYTFDLRGIKEENSIKNFENGLNVNDSSFLKGITSTNDKGNTKFYIKDFEYFNQSFKHQNDEFLTTIITSNLFFDDTYLGFKLFNTDFFALSGDYDSYLNVGRAVLSSNETLVSVALSSGNLATIYIEKDGVNFNLKAFDDGFCIFTVNESPTIFNYIYSIKRKELTFSTEIGNDSFFLTRDGENLTLSPLNNASKTYYLNNGFRISKQIFSSNEYPQNSKIGDYNNDLSIDNIENVRCNHLLHRTGNEVSIITLKNSINQFGSFSSTVNNLSSSSKFKVSGIRKYTSINSDIRRLNDNELSMNYVFGNQEYIIHPGVNSIQTPENMYPFDKININDTNFMICGAYPHISPIFSDVIYKYNDNTVMNNQHLLCTWLSGNSDASVWVDRYYYPDLITKEQALSGNSLFYSTYENEIENMIINNQDLENSIIKNLYFDKISDMCFNTNESYIYDRINIHRFDELSSITYNICNTDINYFKSINKEGAFELSFYFDGGTDVWQLSSKRNEVDGGFTFTKNIDNTEIKLNLYNPSTRTFENFTVNAPYKHHNVNFFAVSVDALDGVGYFFMNDKIILMFTFEQAQYINKNILFGDFIFPTHVENVRVYPRYRTPREIEIYPIIDSIKYIDDITISLPSGTRNSVDVLEIIQNVCDSASYKSNIIDISINNIDISGEDLINFKASIQTHALENLPITTTIRNIHTNI